ncbi:hypothetical protein NKH33_14145 [Mesorhizobium sp. M1182]|uniref:hypothetical protein n=1 Tax=Mesorhizobium sp. M1182 TaxID=2957067 RepID=UPI0033373FC4
MMLLKMVAPTERMFVAKVPKKPDPSQPLVAGRRQRDAHQGWLGGFLAKRKRGLALRM